MTRIPAVPVYPSFLFIFQEDKIIAEIKKWNSKYCSLISDSCFQWLHADRKFWSRRYLFPHLCIHISDNTGYPDREFFFLIQEELNSFKESIAIKGPVDRMQRSVAETFQEVIELTGSLCFMFRSTPTSEVSANEKALSTPCKRARLMKQKLKPFWKDWNSVDPREFCIITSKNRHHNSTESPIERKIYRIETENTTILA